MSDASIAVLGGTGHVGKVIVAGLAGSCPITVYARRPEAAARFVAGLPDSTAVGAAPLSAFGTRHHAAVVNCIGIGDPARATADPSAVYAATQYADDLALPFLRTHPQTRLVSISSGAAYCTDFSLPADATTTSRLRPNALGPHDHYGLAKLASEGRHRAAGDANIIDLRLFGLFSRHIDLQASYLMTDVVRSLLSGVPLVTTGDDFSRDYVAPSDLSALVAACIEASPRNGALDVYSVAPARKLEILDSLVAELGLEYRVEAGGSGVSTRKVAYYSLDHAAAEIGYTPTKTSIETLLEECAAIVSG